VGSCSNSTWQKYSVNGARAIGRENGFRTGVEIVRMLYGAVYQFEEQNFVSGLDLAPI
jgi:hypothetical protein